MLFFNIDSLRILNICKWFELCLERRLDINITFTENLSHQPSDCFVCVYATI